MSNCSDAVDQVTASIARLRGLCRRAGYPTNHVPTYELVNRAENVPTDVYEASAAEVAHFLAYGVTIEEKEPWRRQAKRKRERIRQEKERRAS